MAAVSAFLITILYKYLYVYIRSTYVHTYDTYIHTYIRYIRMYIQSLLFVTFSRSAKSGSAPRARQSAKGKI